MFPSSDPILSCAAAGEFEAKFFKGDEAAEWTAMARAGDAVARGVIQDFSEIGGFPLAARVLVLAGKGHNAGDALIAARRILEEFPGARAEVAFVFGDRGLRPLTQRAWRELSHQTRGRVTALRSDGLGQALPPRADYDLCLDGVFGFQFKPPLAGAAAAVLRRVNGLSIRLRAAVDLPSGLGERDAFRADFTYATGIVKSPVLDYEQTGRLRYLDLDFFAPGDVRQAADRVLLPAVLGPLAALRPPFSDKRTYGQVCLIGGSVNFPGAILMATLSALRSGAGLVTACVPASLAPSFAARAPEAMWVGLPETPAGALALAGRDRVFERLERADALVIGPGLGRDPEAQALVAAIIKSAKVPVLLDADALQRATVRASKTPLVLTPHAGEFARIAGRTGLRAYCGSTGATVVLKGPVTRVATKGPKTANPVFHSFFGGPVLARGGSGDILAGLVGGLLAQTPDQPLLAACRGVTWHGLAADALARDHGQTSVHTTQLLDYLPVALRTV